MPVTLYGAGIQAQRGWERDLPGNTGIPAAALQIRNQKSKQKLKA
jgi:hypothetical protein